MADSFSVLPLVILFIFGNICFGQRLRPTLTTSTTTVIEGSSLTFKCTIPRRSIHIVTWRAVSSKGREMTFSSRILGGNRCIINRGKRGHYFPLRKFTCTVTGYALSVTVQAVEFQTYHGTRWTCELSDRFARSNVMTIDVIAPLVTVTFINSTKSPVTVAEGDTVKLSCETNPTWPPSTVTWVMRNQTLTRGVTSQTRKERELTVTVGTLTLMTSWRDNREIVQCVGQYKRTVKASSSITFITKVPLANVNIFMNETTDGDMFSLTCETNPTYPPSRIIWMQGHSEMSRDVTSHSCDLNGKTLTVSNHSVTCKDDLNGIYCIGLYTDRNISSTVLAVFIQCKANQTNDGGQGNDLSVCVGVGAATGAAVCVVVLCVVGLVIPLCRRHGLACTARDGEMVKTLADGSNMYDKMDDTTMQAAPSDNYEEIRLYENSLYT